MVTGGIFRTPIAGPLFERCGAIRVDRGTDVAAHAVRVTQVALSHGGHVVTHPEGRIGLTPEGVAAHDRVSRAVGRVRRHVADGLSRSEYERTILVLSRMVDNIERALGRTGDQPRR